MVNFTHPIIFPMCGRKTAKITHTPTRTKFNINTWVKLEINIKTWVKLEININMWVKLEMNINTWKTGNKKLL